MSSQTTVQLCLHWAAGAHHARHYVQALKALISLLGANKLHQALVDGIMNIPRNHARAQAGLFLKFAHGVKQALLVAIRHDVFDGGRHLCAWDRLNRRLHVAFAILGDLVKIVTAHTEELLEQWIFRSNTAFSLSRQYARVVVHIPVGISNWVLDRLPS